MWQPKTSSGRSRAKTRRVAGALAFCVVLAVVHTWPLASAPGTFARIDNADTALNAWAIAWVAHQLPRDPARLFDANIFYPEPRALAFSEPLIVPGLMVAPLLWFGASAVLAHNVALLAGMALTAFAGYLLAYRLTRYHLAALAAASLAAFNALTLTSIPQIQMHHGWGILLAVLGLDMVLVEPRRMRGAVVLAAALLATALTSGYLAVMALTAVTVAAVVRAPELLSRRCRPARRNLAVAAVITAALVAFLLSAYWRAHAEQGLTRGPATPADRVAASYLATGARIHHAAWSEPFSAVARLHLFPGVLPAGLALLALATARGRLPRRRVRMLVVIALVGVFFSFGAANPVYMGLYRLLPPLQGLRIVARFGLLMLMAVAVLAAVGMLQLRRRFGARPWFRAVAIGLLLWVNVEVLRAPRPYPEFRGIPEIYDVMRTTAEDAVLVEFPFPPAQRNGPNAQYMLASTRHWRPLVNGYSGFVPASYRRRAEELARFPADNTLPALIADGVTHLMVHSREWAGGLAAVETLRRRRELVLVADDDEGRFLFAVRR